MHSLINKIQSKIKSNIFLDYDMKKSTWFRAGGNALGYVIVNDIPDLKTIISYSNQIKYYIVGVGSNLMVRDGGFDGLIIKLGKNFNKIKINEDTLSVGAGALDVNLAKFALQNLIKDFEFFSGIPGTIGGSIKMNSGCYGKDMSDILYEVKILDRTKGLNNIKRNKLDMTYRKTSINDESIILSAKFRYSSENKDKKNILDLKQQRKKTQPINKLTGGSTFKNPSGYKAWKLIEEAGCRGLSLGGAKVSEMHTNFIINYNNATANDIESLGNIVKSRVYKNSGIKLEWEILKIGFSNK